SSCLRTPPRASVSGGSRGEAPRMQTSESERATGAERGSWGLYERAYRGIREAQPFGCKRARAREPRERSGDRGAPARERVGEFEGRSPSDANERQRESHASGAGIEGAPRGSASGSSRGQPPRLKKKRARQDSNLRPSA